MTPQAEPAGLPSRDRVLVIRAGSNGASGLRSLESRYPDLEFVYCDSFLSGIVEASRHPVRAVLARVDDGPKRLPEAVGALREAGGREARIVLCCSPEHEPEAREALASGADDYIIEPLQGDDVDRAIRYGRVKAYTPHITQPPSLSMEELTKLSGIIATIGASPRDLIERIADFVREALNARSASIVVEGAIAESGERAPSPVLTSALKQGERTIGQLTVSEHVDGKGYSLADAQKLEHYASVISSILSTAKRQRQLHQLAVTDEASGLPNRRYFREQLASLLKRASAERFAITVLLFDVDNFKTYNDEYGHDAGDEILRVTGELFRKHCRDQDIIARYGGDEFAVIFWDADGPREPGSRPLDEALNVVDRFKYDLRTHRFKTLSKNQEANETQEQSGSGDASEEGPTITISGGLATYPWDGSSVDSLMTKADEALLSAKRAGKNRIFTVGGS